MAGSRPCPSLRESAVSRTITTDRDIRVSVGDGAVMTVPRPEWLWQLTWVRPEPDRGTKCDDRMLVVSSLSSYLHLIQECTKEEAWRRIKALREALSLASAQSTSPVMQAAEKAAKVVDGWSDEKKAYADRVTGAAVASPNTSVESEGGK